MDGQMLEMNAPQPQATLPETKTVTEDLAKPLDDNMVRQMVMNAEKAGEDVAAATMAAAQTIPDGRSSIPQAPPVEAPQKFLNPDGTVDVEKLKASTKQLDEGIQQKQQLQEKTIEDYLQEYKEKEKAFRSLPSNPDVIRRQIQTQAPPPAPPAPVEAQPNDLAVIRARIQQDLQVDPVGTIIDLVKAVSQRELEPIEKERQARLEAAKDDAIRKNLQEIASQDRRILDPQIYQAVTQEIASDPGYASLRNPHLAAWSVVERRLRLGSPQQTAQPGRPPSPILGGGTPPPVSSASGPVTARALMGAIPMAKTPQEMSAVEQQLRSLLAQMD